MIQSVTDPADARLDAYRRLNDVSYRRRFEEAAGLFIAEGLTVVRRLIESGLVVESVLGLAPAVDRLGAVGAPVYVVDRSTLAAVVGFDLHRGIVACGRRPSPVPLSALLGLGSLAVIEGVNDHQNLGAVFRAAVGLGIEGVLLDPTTADPWYRRSVRVSMGAVFSVPVTRSIEWEGDLRALRRSGFTLVAMTPAADAMPLGAVVVGRPAVMVGAEGPGLTDAALAVADVRARIPMVHIDSLNVGQAAAVAYAILMRGRLLTGSGDTPPAGSAR